MVFASLSYFAFLLVAENDLKRIVIQIIASSFFYGGAAFSLFLNKGKYKFSIIISTALFIYAVFQLYRAFVLYHIDQPYNFMNGSPIDNWYLIISMFVICTLRIGFIMLLKEIDQKTIVQKNIKVHHEKLKIEELNRTKDKLFSIIAHDLRSPFSGVAGLSELLIKNINNWEVSKVEKYLNVINTTANNTITLLDNLLNWAKSQTGQLSFNSKRIIFTDLIEEIIALTTTLAKSKNITLKYSEVDVIEVFADEEMLKTVLRNLISNAIKFTRSGGQITIGAVTTKDCVEFTISDNGIGMNEDMQSQIFDLSANTTTIGTANEKGSGLGLLLCKEFVERQNGKIWVESEEGKGSDFKFTLPINASIVRADS